MKFRTQLFLGNGIVLLLMLIIAVVQYNSINAMSETSKWVDFTYQAIEKANTLNKILGEMESADRGFLLAGDEKYLEPYYNGKEDFEEVFTSLKEQLVINPQQTARLRDINKLVQSWHQKVAMPEIELRKKVAHDSLVNMNHVLAAVKNDVGRNMMEDIRSRLQEVADTERALLDERAKENEAVSNMAINVSTYGTLLALALGCMVALFISRNLMQQIGGEPSEVADVAKRVSEGDLTMEFSNENRQGLYGSIQNMVEKLKEVISSVTSAADNISSASQQMSGSSQQMSEGATEQAASAEEVSSSMEEMAANIQQNTDNAQQTEKIALQVSEDVTEGSRAVNQTVDSMRKIAEKITIIGEIARQTNLLALNAAVEAARAGEHGKGFAVVAAEVRKLAERSQVAANEINELSSTSVAIADKSGRLLEQIVPNIQKTSRLVQEITAASMEQNSGAGQVNNAIQQLNQIIQQNAASAEEMASGSEELSSQADQLKDTVSFFNIGKSSYGQSRSKGKRKQQVPVVHLNGNGKGMPKKAASGKTGLQLDLNGHDNMDQEFERF